MKSTLCLLGALCLAEIAALGQAADAPLNATLLVNTRQPGAIINRNIYGQFSEHLGHCIYGGVWVGEDSPIPNTRGIRNDVVGALKALKVPVLRWPGGCFADEYHWKDGIGPRDQRPSMINTHWGGVTENNAFGTHEFMDFCEQIGAQPYVCGNLGSGTVQEMMEWVEYMTSDAQSPMANLRRKNGRAEPWKVAFFGVGNESWGCGGDMPPDFYAENFLRYNTFVKDYSGNRVYRIACGANGADYKWTESVMSIAGRHLNGLSLHYYCGTGRDSHSATEFGEGDWIYLLNRASHMEELISRHSQIMDRYDPDKKAGLMVDEWGAWHNVEPGTNPGFLYQQNTLRDALVAGLTLNIFNRHSDRVKMANIAQLVNVLQAMILTDNEKMVLTPTYYVFQMYAVHQDAILLPSEVASPRYTLGDDSIPAVTVSASRDNGGKVHISLTNADPHHSINLSGVLDGMAASSVSGRMLTAPAINSYNSFTAPNTVQMTTLEDAKIDGGKLAVTLPPKSVVMLEIQ
ncbi:MAG TPA: alpha-N-arabinofuranosidase [Verrucomicrobiae bacterium]|jgi:alpha-N-arabinofuranosidase